MHRLIVLGALAGFCGMIGMFFYYYSNHQTRQQELLLEQEREKAAAAAAEKERMELASKKAAEDKKDKLAREAKQRQIEAQQRLQRELAREDALKKRAAEQAKNLAKFQEEQAERERLRQAEAAAQQAREQAEQERLSSQKKAEAAKLAGEAVAKRKRALQEIAMSKGTLTQAKKDQTAAQNRINGALKEMRASHDEAVSWARQMGYTSFDLPSRDAFAPDQPTELSYWWGWYDPSRGKGATLPGGVVVSMDTREQIGKAKARYDRAVKEYTNMKALLDKANTDVQSSEGKVRVAEATLKEANDSLTGLGLDPETAQAPIANDAPPGGSAKAAASSDAIETAPGEVDIEKEMANGLKAMFLLKDKTTVYAYMVMRSEDKIIVKTKDGSILTLKKVDIEQEMPLEKKR